MKPSAQLNQAPTDQTDLEFALETLSGFLVVVKGSGNDGRVTLAVRRRVGTPPASAIGLTPDEVKRLINVLGELSPAALKDREKHNVGRARDAYLDDLMGSHNEPESAELDVFMERDFPGLANKRKRTNATPKTFLGAESSDPIHKLSEALANFKLPTKEIAFAGCAVVLVIGIALSAVALLNYKPFAHHAKVAAEAVPAPTSGIDEFSKSFVLDMLTFKADNYRQAQVRAMAEMSPELAQKYWQETGFPLSRKQLKAIPQDQEVKVASVTTVPISVQFYQVDVEGSVIARPVPGLCPCTSA